MALQDVARQYWHLSPSILISLWDCSYFPCFSFLWGSRAAQQRCNESSHLPEWVRWSAKHVGKQEVSGYQFLAKAFLHIFRLMPDGNRRSSSVTVQCNFWLFVVSFLLIKAWAVSIFLNFYFLYYFETCKNNNKGLMLLVNSMCWTAWLG